MGNSFLRDIAELFFDRVGGELYKYRFFFQSKRAGSFFLHYLKLAAGDQPLILPEVTTLYSHLRRKVNLPDDDINNDLLVVYELYKAYREVYQGSDHTFQSFYNIGKQILADFNDIDMHLVNTSEIFKNLDELEALNVDPSEYMDEEQLEALRRFVKTIDSNKIHDQGYSTFWKKIPILYQLFKERLSERGLIYTGMLMRGIVGQLEEGSLDLFSDQRVNVFIGLNALTVSEQTILEYYRQNEALFYWDYDLKLLRKSFSDRFRRSNMRQFPEPKGLMKYLRAKPVDRKPDQIEVISVPSKVGQSVYLDQVLLEKLEINEADPNIAIILPDESQLTTLLSMVDFHKGGDREIKINVTMGYPVRELSIVAKLLHLLRLHRAVSRRGGIWRREEIMELYSLDLLGTQAELARVLREDEKKLYFNHIHLIINDANSRLLLNLDDHNLMDYTITIIELLQQVQEEEDRVSQLVLKVLWDLLIQHRASLFRYDPESNELLDFETLYDVVFTTLSNTRVPFEGEPLRGLQIMGVLEARTIDFEQVIIFDASEGLLPANSRQYGLIPQSVRSGYNLPTYKWQDDIRAYNFFHLIGRAEKVYALYDSRKGDRSSGEPSRYLRLLEYIYGVPTKHTIAGFKHLALNNDGGGFKLDHDRVEGFRNEITVGERYLSPSRILQYVTCPRKFYYQSILGIRERDELTEIIDKRLLGNLVHNAMERLYPVECKLLTPEMLKGIGEERIKQTIIEVFEEEFSVGFEDTSSYNQAIVETVVQVVKGIVNQDIEYAPFLYIASEAEIRAKVKLNGLSINIGGKIDRLDLKDSFLRVIDYKTGSDRFEIDLDKSFSGASDTTHSATIQLFIYSLLLTQPKVESEPSGIIDQPYHASQIKPRMLKPISREMEPFFCKDCSLFVDTYSDVREYFEKYLFDMLHRIAVSDEAFVTNNKKGKCNYCSARDLCPDANIINY